METKINDKETERAIARFKDTDRGDSIGFALKILGFECDPDDMELYIKDDFRIIWDWDHETQRGSWILVLNRNEANLWDYDLRQFEEILKYLRPFAIEPLKYYGNRGLPLEYRKEEYFKEHFKKLHS